MNKKEICQLLPHSGNMCLIDKIISWDSTTLAVQTESHLNSNNPLRKQDFLSSIIGVEYAAQTMALHAALLSQKDSQQEAGKQKQGGYLATIRNLQIDADYLCSPDSDNSAPLDISVLMLLRDSRGYSYEFTITADNNQLLSGRLTIFLSTNS